MSVVKLSRGMSFLIYAFLIWYLLRKSLNFIPKHGRLVNARMLFIASFGSLNFNHKSAINFKAFCYRYLFYVWFFLLFLDVSKLTSNVT